jgi:hypothetical protein
MNASVSDNGRFVTIPSLEYVELTIAAGQWHLLRTSPHVAALLDEWCEWDRRRQSRESSWGISSVHRGRWDHVPYAELERRRAEYSRPALSAEAVRIRARKSWAQAESNIQKRAGAA